MAGKKINKKFCALCGKKAGLISKVVMEDGVLCEPCLLATGIVPTMKNYLELQEIPVAGLMHYAQKVLGDLDDIENFQATEGIADIAFFNDLNKTFIIRDGLRSDDKAEDYRLVHYDKLLGAEIEEDAMILTRVTRDDSCPRIGELSFGPEGARVGDVVIDRKIKNACVQLKINMIIDDPYCKQLTINLVGIKTKHDTDLYRQSIRMAYDIVAKMDAAMHGEMGKRVQDALDGEAEDEAEE